MGSATGVRLQDQHYLKYSISVTRVGQQVYSEVFSWGYTAGSSQRPIKDALLSLDQYSASKFRKDFNAAQREKITRGDPVSSYDITLTYKLLQLLCGLRGANDMAWVAEAESLEYYLHAIKNHRNEVSHDTLNLSVEELTKKMEALGDLFVKTIQKAGETYSVESRKVDTLVKAVTAELDAIKTSPLPLATIEEYRKEVVASRKARLIEEGRKEVIQRYEQVCEVSVAPWLVGGRRRHVEELFTAPKVRREPVQIRERQLSPEESYVSVSNLLEATECDGTESHVTLVAALSGMGKSTLLKFILGKVKNDQRMIVNMDKFDLILFLECRHSMFRSVEGLAALLLPRTAASSQPEDFLQALLTVDLLLVLDDVDDLDEAAFSILLDFLRRLSPNSRLLATVTRDRADNLKRKFSSIHKHALVLELEGIPHDDIPVLLQRIMACVSPLACQQRNDVDQLHELIQSKLPCLQEHLRSPEVLGLVALSWVLAPDRINSSATVTEVIMLLEDLQLHKVIHNVMELSGEGLSAQYVASCKLRKYLLTLSGVALQCLLKGKWLLEEEDLQKLTDKCRSLDLPESYMMSVFLSYSTESDSSSSSSSLCSTPRAVPFPRRLTLLYYAAWYTVQRLRVAPLSTTIREFLKLHSLTSSDSRIPSLQVLLKHVVGMLVALAPGKLISRARELTQLLKDLGVRTMSEWVQYIEEAKEESTITQEIMREVGDEWEVTDFAISITFANIMRSKNPRRLVVTALESPKNLPHLQEALHACAASPELKLSLYLYQHFWSEKTDVSDSFLETVSGGVSSCKLEHFAGRLSGPAITLLPSSLQRLALHVSPDSLNALNAVLPSLTALQMLYLNLDLPTSTNSQTLSPLNTQGRPMILSADLWRVTEVSIPWSCDIVRALSTHYTRLALRRSELCRGGCGRWVAGLRARGVTVDSLLVGSTLLLTSQDRDHILTDAAGIGCKDVKVMKV